MRRSVEIDGIRYDLVGDDLIPEWVTNRKVSVGAMLLHFEDDALGELEERLRRRTGNVRFNQIRERK